MDPELRRRFMICKRLEKEYLDAEEFATTHAASAVESTRRQNKADELYRMLLAALNLKEPLKGG